MDTKERILAALPATNVQLLAELKISSATLHKWLTRMHKSRPKQIHILRWIRTRGALAPVWAAGPGRDAKRPKPMTAAKKAARYRERLKESGEYEELLAKRRKYGARTSKRRATYAADPLLAALFSPPK